MEKTKKLLPLIMIIVGLILIAIGIIASLSNNKILVKEEIKDFSYEDHYTPPTNYKLKLNSKTKELTGSIHNTCSYTDCKGRVYECSITLDDTEYEKVLLLWEDQETLAPILDSFCKDKEVLYKSFEESDEEDITIYNRMDSNSDGKITYREFANDWLNDVLDTY